MNAKTLKVLSFVVAIIGAGVSLVSHLIAEKELDLKIAEEVAKVLSKGAGS